MAPRRGLRPSISRARRVRQHRKKRAGPSLVRWIKDVSDGAPCSSTIRAAQAVVEEIPSASGTSIGALASCTASHSERDVHKVSKQFGLGLPIPLTQVEISKGIQIPVILLSSWANFFLSLNLWHTLSGLDSPDDDRCKAQWTSFWRNFEKIMPHHQVFDLARSGSLDLSRTAGIVVHGDEGRSEKKTAIMVLSAHSILGKGCAVKNRRATLKTDFAKQDLNIIGNTWTTRWLLGVLPRGYYDPKKGDSEAYDRMSQALVDDMNGVIATGIRSLTGETHWLVPLYVIGDWPFHAKTFHLTRTFGSVAKQPTSKTDSKGICMFCNADQPGYPWEDFESENPRWRTTIGTSCPFARDPAFLQLPHNTSMPESIIGLDIFHGWHIGAGKVFVSSTLVLVSEQFDESSVPKRFEKLHDCFFAWCRRQGVRPYIRKLSQETIKWMQTTEFPSGAWSKGSTTTCLLRFIIDFCKERETSIEETLLSIAYKAALEIDAFLSKIYKEGVWIHKEKALEISSHGMTFLRFNGRLAFQAFQQGRALYPFMPNLHRCHEIFFGMVDQAKLGGHALNPLTWCCQMAEDFIGKPSRISRRVSCRLAVQRTLQRSLLAHAAHLREAGIIR